MCFGIGRSGRSMSNCWQGQNRASDRAAFFPVCQRADKIIPKALRIGRTRLI